ncbi:Piezo-type mechanosensitive ion channel component 2 [Labeo rohita]|uniref:Piezo-type mechanosensitive ion channel component 2 n=1 Tax=Labeo rohita TaxID=84645 RepID=A0ABQ8MDG1_LABRO|nr:Piezo-type mechanosensitive ion channel component 2 [Labeo rohita]
MKDYAKLTSCLWSWMNPQTILTQLSLVYLCAFCDGDIIREEVLGLIPLEGRITAEIIFQRIVDFFSKVNGLNLERFVNRSVKSLHCLIHQSVLCSRLFSGLKNTMDSVMAIINFLQVKIESPTPVISYNVSRHVSRALCNALQSVCELREEIVTFLCDCKHKHADAFVCRMMDSMLHFPTLRDFIKSSASAKVILSMSEFVNKLMDNFVTRFYELDMPTVARSLCLVMSSAVLTSFAVRRRAVAIQYCSVVGKTGRFLLAVCSTGVTFLALQCGMQITFTYIPKDVTGPWDNIFFNFGIVRFSDVDTLNIIRLLMPDFAVFLSTLFILHWCKAKKPHHSENCRDLYNSEGSDGEISDSECEGESTTSSFGSSVKSHTSPLSSPDVLQKLIIFLTSLRLLMSSVMNTAGKVLVTVLLCLAGITFPSLTSALYFMVFLGLVWCWVLDYTISLLHFSSLCVMMTIFSGGHILILLFGLTALIQTNMSEPYILALHEDGSWPAMVHPLVLLLLYFSVMSLLHNNLNIYYAQENVESFAEASDILSNFSKSHHFSPERKEVRFDRSTFDQAPPIYINQVNPCQRQSVLAECSDFIVSIPSGDFGGDGMAAGLRALEKSCDFQNQDPLGGSVIESYYNNRCVLKRLVSVSNGQSGERCVASAVDSQHINYFELLAVCLVALMLVWKRTWQDHEGSGLNSLIVEDDYPNCFAFSPYTQNVSYCTSKSTEYTVKKESCGGGNGILNDADSLSSTDASGPSALNQLGQVIMKQSYLIALIITMVWSISYNSWLTLVLLVWSCAIWMLKDRRRYAMLSAPLLAVYGTLLLVVTFISQLHLNHIDIFPTLPKDVLIDFDVYGYPVPCVHLATKLKEKNEEDLQTADHLMEVKVQSCDTSQASQMMILLGTLVKGILVKYWIFCCCFMFFFVSFSDKVAVYKILYICLFLFCVVLYEVHYEVWRSILKHFWAVVVGYSMLVLILIYVYQFKSVCNLFQQILGIPEERLRDIGLEQFDTIELFARILLPAFFLLACILQLHYFNCDFLSLTDLQTVVPRNKIDRLKERQIHGKSSDQISSSSLDEHHEIELEDDVKQWLVVMDRVHELTLQAVLWLWRGQELCWRILELHSFKLVSTAIIWVCVQEVRHKPVYSLHIQYLFNVAGIADEFVVFGVVDICSAIFETAAFGFQCVFCLGLCDGCGLTSCNESSTGDNRAELLRNSVLYLAPVDPAIWVGGLRKCEDHILPCLWNHLLILGLLVFDVTVHRHQLHHRLQNGLKVTQSRTIFQGVTHQHLDHGILPSLKYFANYFFYKFGLEVCFVVAVNVIGQRMDVCALLHSFALMAVLSRRRRKAIGEVWPKYCCFIASFMVLQYLLCIGLPPALCIDYPWRKSSAAWSSNLIKWLYLPDHAMSPNANFILYDCLLLLVASLQWQVFEDENQACVRLLAGENVEISRNLDPQTLNQYTPVNNFLHCRSYLDMVKLFVFSYFFWLVLCLIFITGTTRINIFCLGYLVACFYFMLFGGTLLLQPVQYVLRLWDCLIAYTCVVISLKNMLSLGSCVYLEGLQKHGCWLIQAFSMFCTINGYNLPKPDNQCELPEGEAGIVWDAICFTVLLAQRRVFLSYYFLYVVSDLQTSKVLASSISSQAAQFSKEDGERTQAIACLRILVERAIRRVKEFHIWDTTVPLTIGAELFEAKVKKQVAARLEMEKKSVEILKKQMEKIKSKQEIAPYQEVTSSAAHAESSYCPKQNDGDCGYDLFETDSEEEEEEMKDKTQDNISPKKKTAFQLVSLLSHRMEKIKSKQEIAPYQEVTSSAAHAESSYCPKQNGSPL